MNRVIIRGRRWRVMFDGRVGPGADGDCDVVSRTIRIRRDLAPGRMLEVAAHEAIHAALPDLDEAAVAETAQAVVLVLAVVLPGLDKI